MALVIDNVNKFMSTKSCLARIYEIYNEYGNGSKAQIIKEFRDQSVIANWGIKKAYRVTNVLFDDSPVTKFFENTDGDKTSVAEYFLKTYGMKVTDKK